MCFVFREFRVPDRSEGIHHVISIYFAFALWRRLQIIWHEILNFTKSQFSWLESNEFQVLQASSLWQSLKISHENLM